MYHVSSLCPCLSIAAGRDVLSIANRGFETKMMPSYGQAFDQSICESCGNCVSSCPTGALTAKDTKEYRKWETQKIPTTCPHCGTGCQMNLLVKNNRLVGVEPLMDQLIKIYFV